MPNVSDTGTEAHAALFSVIVHLSTYVSFIFGLPKDRSIKVETCSR
jgi:hypothetical protein